MASPWPSRHSGAGIGEARARRVSRRRRRTAKVGEAVAGGVKVAQVVVRYSTTRSKIARSSRLLWLRLVEVRAAGSTAGCSLPCHVCEGKACIHGWLWPSPVGSASRWLGAAAAHGVKRRASATTGRGCSVTPWTAVATRGL